MRAWYALILAAVSITSIGYCSVLDNETVTADLEEETAANNVASTELVPPNSTELVIHVVTTLVSSSDTKLVSPTPVVLDGTPPAESSSKAPTGPGSNPSKLVPNQTFKEAEKEILDFVNSILKELLPKVVSGSGAAELSQRCVAGMMKLFGNVRRLKGWTIKMIDSMGKTTPGILMGTSYTLGNYDECLDLSISNKGEETSNSSLEMFRGKYCRIKIQLRKSVVDTAEEYHKGLKNASDLRKLKELIQFIPHIPVDLPYLTHFIGLCFPSTCTSNDINYLAKLVPFPGTASLDRCEVKTETEVEHGQLILICIFLFLVLLACLSTFVDWWTHSGSEESLNEGHDTFKCSILPFHAGTNESVAEGNSKKCVSVSIAFSFCNNTKRLMKGIEEDVDGLLSGKSVRGIVVVAVVWIIAGTAYFFPSKAFYIQSANLRNLHIYWDKAYFSVLQGYPLALDVLFVCYGFILTYSIWYATSKSQNVKVNVIGLVIKYYIRLCIPLAFCYGVMFVVPLLGSGPFWNDLMDNTLNRCRSSAWYHFGMFANFLDMKEQCLPHLWFVSCLAQLSFIGIILSWIISKRFKLGILLILILCIGGNVIVGIITYHNKLPPAFVPYFANGSPKLLYKLNMSWPLSHFGSYAMGMLSGLLVARRERHRSRMCIGCIGWITCAVVLFGIFAGLYCSRDSSLGDSWSAVYASLHRTVFGACVAWVIVSGAFGVGGFVDKILSWKIFDPLFKLSYYAFIFHLLIIGYSIGTSRTHLYYSHFELICRITFYTAASYVVAYIFFMLLEMPLYSLLSVLCPKKTQQIEVTSLNNFKVPAIDVISKSKNTIGGSCKLWSISETHYGELK